MDRLFLCLKVFKDVSCDLERFGQRVAGEIYELGFNAELNQPKLQHYDAWGRPVHDIITSPEWKRLKEISAKEGLIAIGYENQQQEWRSVMVELQHLNKIKYFSLKKRHAGAHCFLKLPW